MTTLKEVALAAGVHVATASAVLNGGGGNTRVSAETQKRVLAAAKKLSYVPNESARRLRTGRSNTVGFLGGDLRNPFFAELAAVLEEQLATRQLQLLVSHVAHRSDAFVQETIRGLQQQGISRIICWDETPVSRRKGHESILSIGFTNKSRPGVWLDLEHAIYISVRELIRLGYRRLGFFAPGLQKESPSVSIRSRIFIEECEKQGVPPPAMVSYDGESWDLEAATSGARAVVRRGSEVEGWLGFNDVSALGLLSALPFRQVRSVLCFDGTAAARCWSGHPPRLNLQITEFATKVADVLNGELSPMACAARAEWVKPVLSS